VGLRFGDLTPEEFLQIVEGYHKREERDWYRTAWMVAYLLKPWSKRGGGRLTPEKLLGRRVRRKAPAPTSSEETRE
jgi:hypothetical protein